MAQAQPPSPQPSICAPAPSTVTADFGAYRGDILVVDEDGRAAFARARFGCPTAAGAHRWEGCSFSLCNLPDGDYGFRFSRLPPQSMIAFTLRDGVVRMAPTPLAVQAGNYGIDATGSRVRVLIDLAGYTGPWQVEGWPGNGFMGSDTGNRGEAQGGSVALSLYPATPYAIRFGSDAIAQVSASFSGELRLADGRRNSAHPLRLQGGRLVLRGARIAVTAKSGGGTWRVEQGTAEDGKLVLPAGGDATLVDNATGAAATLTLDDTCRPAVSGAGAAQFAVAAVPAADLTCP